MFYYFGQNNSGGSFNCDASRGIGHYVIVEADSKDEANSRAERIGLYFDGEGDCECCGNRWSPTYSDGTAEPMLYGQPVTFVEDRKAAKGFVHYKNGEVKAFNQ